MAGEDAAGGGAVAMGVVAGADVRVAEVRVAEVSGPGGPGGSPDDRAAGGGAPRGQNRGQDDRPRDGRGGHKQGSKGGPRGRNRIPKGRPLDGWLIVDKPSGMGSTDVVTKLKRAFDAQKVGHGGTLDPLATGLLPIAFGAATKAVPYVMDSTKIYRFTLRMGDERDSDDADGRTIATSDYRPTDAQIEAALPAFRGDIMQVPPIYSAIKVGGERAYDLAREGQVVELAARPARVDRFELVERVDDDTAIFHVESGKGVYMRSLARDLARAAGTVGHITALRRLRVGPFREEHAIPLDSLIVTGDTPPPSPALLLPVTTALDDIPALAVTEAEAARLSFGQELSLVEFMGRVPQAARPDGGLVRVLVGERLMGLCRLGDGLLHPERWLARGGS